VIGDALRAELDRHARKAEGRQGLAGQASGPLDGVRYILSCAPRQLARARDLATQAGLLDLAEHYQRMLEREILREAESASPLRELLVTAAAHSFVAYVEARVEEDPCLYLACSLGMHAEVFEPSDTDGPITQEEDLECLDEVISDPKKLCRLREVLRESIDLFEKVVTSVAPAINPLSNRSALFGRYRIPPAWSAVAVVEDTFEVDGLEVRRAGVSSTSPMGEEIVGSAADVGTSPVARAYFELLERVSTVEWLHRNNSSCDLLTLEGAPATCQPWSEVVPESSVPGRWRFARSNGIALHVDWESASRRAFWELCERDRVLRAWYGMTVPKRLAVAWEETPLGRTRSYEWLAYSFPEDKSAGFSRGLFVSGVFGMPKTREAPFVFGYGARPVEEEATSAAIREAIQLLAFLWGEPVSSALPGLSPLPAYHLETYQSRTNQDLLRRWLEGEHGQYGRLVAAPLGSAGKVLFADLTPAWLQDLRVSKAVCRGALPLVFGEDPKAAHLPLEFRTHPIA
jgi:hypothetical protein